MTNPWTAFAEFMQANIAPSLRAVHAPLDAAIDTLPLWTGTVCAVGLFVAAGAWAFTFKRSYIYLGAPDQAAWRDLRVWAALILIPYVLVYLFF